MASSIAQRAQRPPPTVTGSTADNQCTNPPPGATGASVPPGSVMKVSNVAAGRGGPEDGWTGHSGGLGGPGN